MKRFAFLIVILWLSLTVFSDIWTESYLSSITPNKENKASITPNEENSKTKISYGVSETVFMLRYANEKLAMSQ